MHPLGSGAQASPSLGGPGFVHSAKAWTEDPPARDSTCNPGIEATPRRPPVPKNQSLMGQLLTAPQNRGAAPKGAEDTGTEDPGPRPSPYPRAASRPEDAPALCFQSYSRFLRSHYLPVCQDEVSEAREALAGVTCDAAHPRASSGTTQGPPQGVKPLSLGHLHPCQCPPPLTSRD